MGWGWGQGCCFRQIVRRQENAHAGGWRMVGVRQWVNWVAVEGLQVGVAPQRCDSGAGVGQTWGQGAGRGAGCGWDALLE